jgi:hypothetical protein
MMGPEATMSTVRSQEDPFIEKGPRDPFTEKGPTATGAAPAVKAGQCTLAERLTKKGARAYFEK